MFTTRKIIEWLSLALTVVLLLVLKWSHLGVLHYNWFLIILLSWCLLLVIFFRAMDKPFRDK